MSLSTLLWILLPREDLELLNMIPTPLSAVLPISERLLRDSHVLANTICSNESARSADSLAEHLHILRDTNDWLQL